MNMIESPFFDKRDRWVLESPLAFVFDIDAEYRVTEGHSLILPKRIALSPDDMTAAEITEVFDLACQRKKQLSDTLGATGFTWGWNDGTDAGQSVAHVHLHLIPRFAGDVPEARGGICRIFDNIPDYYKTP